VCLSSPPVLSQLLRVPRTLPRTRGALRRRYAVVNCVSSGGAKRRLLGRAGSCVALNSTLPSLALLPLAPPL